MSRALPISVAWLRRQRAVPLWMVAGGAAVLTGLIRLFGFGQTPDVFGDEVYYWHIGSSVDSGGFPRYRGGPFFLHPPGFFYLEGAWERLLGSHTDVIAGVYQMRLLNALLAAVTAAVLVVLILRVTRSIPAAVVVGVVYAVDPFVLRLTERVLIETSMMLWVLLGYLVLLPLAAKDPPHRARRRAAVGGLLFGLAILTKDVAALITVLPLLASLVFPWASRRSLPLLAAGFATVPYAIYVGVVAAEGHFEDMWAVKTHGVRRLLGMVQETGFNAEGAPPLTQRVIDELTQFGSTYVLLVLGPVALIPLLRRRGRPQRLLALWYLSAGIALAYAVLEGTLEEQALYMLLVPTIVILAVSAVHLWERRTRHRRRTPVLRFGTVLVLIVTLGLSTLTYASGRSQPDDGYERLRQYLSENVPAGSPITSASGSTDLVLEDRYRVGRWHTPQDRALARVAYVVVPWRLVEQGYSPFTVNEVKDLAAQGELLFSFHGRTYGQVAVYQLPVPPAAVGAGGGGG
ncbi:phospholipid carrier-dependent glycosyltransferase [Streptomyces albidochromogenes]|uniref:phospholipid carrier-dependent glycosyltransferase n=1 Tax=Streptomyces albidochromogenes TaxID=329524 RepID=UPI00142EFA5B|nr:phospholipid carrier-dependent glycosyltransferase [Streptomyces albidochromogenes]